MPRIPTVACVLALGIMLVPHAGAAQNDAAASTAPQADQVEALQDRIRAQPEMMDEVRALQSDAEFQDVLTDPEIAAALESGNFAALLANPKINNLMNHPTVQDITKNLDQH
jgi:hypothetical protein